MKLTFWGIVVSFLCLSLSPLAAQAIKINSSSNVGIGGAPSGNKLIVYGSTKIEGYLMPQNIYMRGYTIEPYGGKLSIYDGEISNNRVGINQNYDASTTLALRAGTNTYALKVEGESYFTKYPDFTSDGKVKRNIKSLKGQSILQKVNQLEPKTYRFKTKDELITLHNQGSIHLQTDTILTFDKNTGERHVQTRLHIPEYSTKEQYGLLAEDLERVFPELVKTDSISNLKAVNYIALIPILVEAIKEQQLKIDLLLKERNFLK